MLSGALCLVLAGAASAGLWSWHLGAIVLVAAGWVAAALAVGRSADRLGVDGQRWAWRVFLFGWLGLVYWFVVRRRHVAAR